MGVEKSQKKKKGGRGLCGPNEIEIAMAYGVCFTFFFYAYDPRKL